MKMSGLSPAMRGSLYVVGGSICISFSPLFVRFVEAGPTTVAFYRLFWGCVALFLVALYRHERLMPSRRMLAIIVLAAAFFTGDLACWHQSIHYIGPGLATIVTNFQVFFLAIIGVLFFKERMGLRLALAIPLAFAGLAMLLEINLGNMPDHVVTGLLLGLSTAVFYTGYILTLRRSQSLDDRLPAVANMAVVSMFGAIFSAGLAVAQGQSLVVQGLQNNVLLLVYGFGCQAFGWYWLSKGLPLLPASRAGLLMLIQPTLSFVWDVLICGRPTGIVGYIGAVVALLAIALGVTDNGARKAEQKTDA